MAALAKFWVIVVCLVLPVATTIWIAASNSDDSSSGSTDSSEQWSGEDGFNPDEEDYSNEANDLDCSDVDGPIEIDPDNDPNNLDRDSDGLACEWN